eukprot:gene57939-biopygen40623
MLATRARRVAVAACAVAAPIYGAAPTGAPTELQPAHSMGSGAGSRKLLWGSLFGGSESESAAHSTQHSPTCSDVASNLDFEYGLGGCPTGWTCTGTAEVVTTAPCGGSGDAESPSGSSYLYLGCDNSKGAATSAVFPLPATVDHVSLLRAGGADTPSGFEVKLALDDSVVCSARTGSNTDDFFEDTCHGLAEYASQGSTHSLSAGGGVIRKRCLAFGTREVERWVERWR